ncbi:MAG: hypothetical protein ACP5NV_02440 [Candidatus Woesearchaeota archaeon]
MSITRMGSERQEKKVFKQQNHSFGMDKTEEYIKQIENIIAEFNETAKTSRRSDLADINLVYLSNLATRTKSAIARITGKNSEYYEDVKARLSVDTNTGAKIKSCIGVIYALLKDMKAGYMTSLQEDIHTNVFSDYLEMAEYLLDEDLKDPSAVIAGSTLEEHLRKLCVKNEISIEITKSNGDITRKKSDTMSAELCAAAVFSKNDQKQITAWLSIRNDAAHGDYNKYNKEQVKLMIAGIREFISRNPA